jgi:hypothetical protein
VRPTASSEAAAAASHVPAIDMTDAVVTSQEPPAPAREKSTSRATSGRKQSPKAKAQPKRTRNGSVGRDTFDQVEALVKEDKTKTEAFKQIAGTTGKNSGTVAANFYRVARSSGAVKPRTARAKVCSLGESPEEVRWLPRASGDLLVSDQATLFMVWIRWSANLWLLWRR